jgi:hypothetical protein
MATPCDRLEQLDHLVTRYRCHPVGRVLRGDEGEDVVIVAFGRDDEDRAPRPMVPGAVPRGTPDVMPFPPAVRHQAR